MRSRGLSFADAVRLLDGGSELVDRLGQAGGLAAGTVTVASAGTVDFFALRDQVVRWGHAAVRSWREKVRGLSRFDRTDRIVAAYSVIVLVAYFEVLGEWLAAHGVDLDAAEITVEEQVALGTRSGPPDSYATLITALVRDAPPLPSPAQPFETLRRRLELHYDMLNYDVGAFLQGLAATQGVTIGKDLPWAAVRRFTELYRGLATEIPEFRLWSEMIDAQATREMIQAAVARLRSEQEIADAVRSGLVRRYEAQLGKPILSAANAPADLLLPTLQQGYQDPAGLAAIAGPDASPATETWWATNGHSVPDVQDFLIAHLTSAPATGGPMVVLGHPGSGKSVLTRVLAARLSTADFLPVRVELRTVRADSPVQRQIEEALYLALGESVTWPDLARRSGTALPVVMMDGFDELLQATGQNWANYLEQLQEFQQREAELGRPVAVLVTSRTVVADRARFPENTTVLRLSPFGDAQVSAWLGVWNALNGAGFAARGVRPLSAGVLAVHRELAEQPLLLLLLALFDGRDNQLQRHGGGIGRVELYERLFHDFFERQVDKFGTALGTDQRDAQVAAEWRRLCAVAVAMHNRGRDVVFEPELESDLRHLLSEDDRAPEPGSRPLTPAQLLVGRFFFVHESRASLDTGAAERSFEFLHATFGEFLTARRIVTALTELAEDRAYLRRRPGATLDAGFFHALTSFTTITRRQPLWEFCQGMVTRLDAPTRRDCRELVLELLAEAGHPHPTWALGGYQPERKTMAARQAAFSANLTCLAVLLSDGPVDAAELVGEPLVTNWRGQALLWMGQLESEDTRRLWQALRIAWDLDTDPARLLVRVEDGTDVSVFASLPWPPEERPAAGRPRWDVALPAQTRTGLQLRKSAFAQTGVDFRELYHAMIPFWRRFGDLSHPANRDRSESDVRALLELLLTEEPGALEFFTASLANTASDVWDFLAGHLETQDHHRRRLLGAMTQYGDPPEA
ncbi:NACHT domain-containing protein [Paractinoplanes rishiriensis]|uniref:NACHT N-terminal Helical domain-containing protein n=1 Tax=Paractinoplanes rishiriensis TaxID=1050105 RepID=A0A919K1M9_9ACTN|nr:hypothetical protein [Actinoplanes rishiriensis]GIE97390.1 hypothetical protein Ari01nite_48550 [Actinoplanes rishiriensis]